ncbi:MAG: hypothetical protein JWM86_231 [Thermoleophilia bacterium]|nr:hypothetical protein [Thermoleophilia bacterium]
MATGVTYREEPCKSALNRANHRMIGWSLNPYMGCAHRCTFCYVRAFEQVAGRASGDEYGESLRIKTNVAEVLRRELARKSWKREPVFIGSATDPYQPVEGRYQLTRSCIAELARARTPVALITRNPMVVRDIDVLTDAARHADVTVTFSIPTLDERIWRLTEPGTPPPAKRLAALTRMIDAGINAALGMAPILPGLTDDLDGMRAVVDAAREAGATSIWANSLYLKPGTREHFLEHVARDFPELREEYGRMYTARPYLPREQVDAVKRQVGQLAREAGIADRRTKVIEREEQLTLL